MMEKGKINLGGIAELLGYIESFNGEGWPNKGIRHWMDKTNSSLYSTYSDSFAAQCAKIRNVAETIGEMIEKTMLPKDYYNSLLGKHNMIPFYKECFTLYMKGNGRKESWDLLNELLPPPCLLPGNTMRTQGFVIIVEHKENPELHVKYNDGRVVIYTGECRQILHDLLSIDNSDYRQLTEITVRIPLPDVYKHWKIVVDDQASGNCQTDTWKNADVCVYVLEDEKDSTMERIYSMDNGQKQENAFYVIMQHADDDFLRIREERPEAAHGNLYCPEKMLHHCNMTALRLAEDSNIDYKAAEKSNTYPGWRKDTWNECQRLITFTRQILTGRGMMFNNENIRQSLTELSGVNSFRQQLWEYMENTEFESIFQYKSRLRMVLCYYGNLLMSATGYMEKDFELEEGSLLDIPKIEKEMLLFQAEWGKLLHLLVHIQSTSINEEVYSSFEKNINLYTKRDYVSESSRLGKLSMVQEDLVKLYRFTETMMEAAVDEMQQLVGENPAMEENLNILRKSPNNYFCMLRTTGKHPSSKTPDEYYDGVQAVCRGLAWEISEAFSIFVRNMFMDFKTSVKMKYKYSRLWLCEDGKSILILMVLINYSTIKILFEETMENLPSLSDYSKSKKQ